MSWRGRALALLLAITPLAACAASPRREPGQPTPWRVLPSPTVTAVAGRAVHVEFRQTTEPPPETGLAERVAFEIARIAYLAPGTEVTLGGIPGRVARVAGPSAEIALAADPGGITVGSSPTLVAASRILAVRDFDVPGQTDPAEARALMDEVTTLLARTGQFRLVERLRLDAVLEELKLSMSDLVSPDAARKVGELLGAETVVTGSLIKRGQQHTVSVRLINARTGEIFNGTVSGGALPPISRSPSVTRQNIAGDFESKPLDETGWDFGRWQGGRTGDGGFQVIELDSDQGAAGTRRSLRLRFKLGRSSDPDRNPDASVRNRIPRDLSRFQAISFYLRASRPLVVGVQLWNGQEESPQVVRWRAFVNAETEWRRYRVRFAELYLARARREGVGAKLDLERVAAVMFFVQKGRNPDVEEGTLWIDEVSFE